MLQSDFLDFLEWHHYFLGRRAATDLQVHVIGGDAADSLGEVLAARRFYQQHHVPVSVAPHHREETGKFRFDKSAVEGELAALENCRRRQR
jgi:hypothetical protein